MVPNLAPPTVPNRASSRERHHGYDATLILVKTGALIDQIVRQTTVLIAELATAGGVRAPLSDVASQVFLELVRELDAQGVSRKVSADMFGMALRTYQRRIQQLSEGSTFRGKSLWQAVYDFVTEQGEVSRARVLERFDRDDQRQVRAVLHDLCESGLLSLRRTNRGQRYRVVARDDLAASVQAGHETGQEEFLWAMVYREGPVTVARLAQQTGASESDVQPVVDRLLEGGRIRVVEGSEPPAFESPVLAINAETAKGWEAAVYDHYQVVVRTIATRLQSIGRGGEPALAGGSTYTLQLPPGHALEEEALALLGEFRARVSDLRSRIDAHNATEGAAPPEQQLLVYMGQCLVERD